MLALYAFEGELARAGRVTSQPLLAEIRLTWWREVLDQIYGAAAVRRHPVAQALAQAVERRGLPREPLEAAIDAWIDGRDADAAGAIAEAAALVLDPATRRAAVRTAGAAWRSGLTNDSRSAARDISAAAFPAVAHAALRKNEGELLRRLRLTWAVLRGRL